MKTCQPPSQDDPAGTVITRINQLIEEASAASNVDRVYSVNQLAELSDLHPDTIRGFLRTGKLKCLGGLRHIRVPALEWRRFQREQMQNWESTWTLETSERVVRNRVNKSLKGGRK